MGKVLVANANPGTASWNPSGVATVLNGTSSITVTGLDASLAGKAVLVSFVSDPLGVASATGVVTSAGLTSTLTITTFSALGVATVTTGDVDVAYLVLG